MDQPYNREDFKSIVLHSGMILSYHEDLHIQIKEDTLLLGLAFSSETENITLENPLKERFHWSGRWILIHDDKLYLDPCGTLGVFWGYCGDKLVCSSSLNLMKSVLETEWIADYQIQYNDGLPYMDYYPIPFTPYRGIQKMYPTQYLDLLNHSFHSVGAFVTVIFSSAVASFGNLIASSTPEYEYKIFQVYRFVGFWLYGF